MREVPCEHRTSPFIAAIIRWQRWVIALWAALVVASTLLYLGNFRIDNSVAIWFLEKDPELDAYRSSNREFGEKEWTYVWLESVDSIASPAFLRDLRLLGERINSLEQVNRVVTLADAGGLVPDPEGGATWQPYLPVDSNQLPSMEQTSELVEKIQNNPRFEGRLVPADDDRFTILAVQNANRLDTIEPYRRQLIDGIRQSVSSFDTIRDFGITGTTVVNSELNRAAQRDMLIYYTLIAAFVLVGGWLVTRRLRDLVVLLSVVLATVLPVLGIIGALGLPFNLMTIMLPTLLVTVSVSYLIHFLGEFHEQRHGQVKRGEVPDTAAALSATFRQLLRPGLWTSVTTGIGFASLTVSPVEPIRHVGFFAAAGIGLAWLATVTLAPALMSLLWRKAVEPAACSESDSQNQKKRSLPLLRWLARGHPALAVVLSIPILAGAVGVSFLEADTDYVKFFRPGSMVRNDYAKLQEIGMPGSYLTVTVKLSEAESLASLERHQAMRTFEQSLNTLPGVLDVQSLDSELDHLTTEWVSANPGTPPDLITGQLLTMFASGASGDSELAREFVSENKRLLQLRVLTGPMSTSDITAFRKRLDELAATAPAHWNIALTGTNVLWANMDAHVVSTQMRSILIVALALVILLPLILRSWILGLLGFVVSFLPALCTLGLMAWLGLPVNIATCILGGVVIGIAVDDAIYYLSRVRKSLQQGLSMEDATREACTTTGRAMIKTSLILTGGFLTMAASDFMPSVYFGGFFAFSIAVALLADLIVLPVLLRFVGPRIKNAQDDQCRQPM